MKGSFYSCPPSDVAMSLCVAICPSQMIDSQDPSDLSLNGPPAERPQEYVADISFDALKLSEPIQRALAERGYTHPTPVQARAFGPALAGKDLIVRSKTGTGKTAAFALPLLEKIDPSEKRAKALVLCPTRELAIQVAAEASDLGKHKGVQVVAIYGGAPMKAQEDALQAGAQIIVGTPGRVFDHIGRGNLTLEHCNHVVLDEADEMLNQGFYEEVTRILDKLPAGRQVLLFSATVPPDIERLIARYTTNAETLLLSGDVLTVDHIKHILYDLSEEYPKPRNLIYVLEMEAPDNAIIFCNTRNDTELVTAVLNRNGFDAELINGDLAQKDRERVMAKVKKGELAFMVATDIAARGIDISGLGHVINYSLPEDPAVYLHRVGRTGRIGNKGVAINLNSGQELSTLSTLEKKYNIPFERRKMPSPAVAQNLWAERHLNEVREHASGHIYEAYIPLAQQLRQRPDAEDLVAFLMKYFFSHLRAEKVQAAAAEGQAAQAHAPSGTARSSHSAQNASRGERSSRERSGRGGEVRGPRRDKERVATKREMEPAANPANGNAPALEGSEEKPARSRRRREKPFEAGPGEARLWVNLGTTDGLDEAGLRSALEALGSPAGKIRSLSLRPTYAYLTVAEEDATALEALNGKEQGAKALKVERSRRT